MSDIWGSSVSEAKGGAGNSMLGDRRRLRCEVRVRPCGPPCSSLWALVLLLEGGIHLFFGTQYGSNARPLIYRPTGRVGYGYIPDARGAYCVLGDCHEVRINPAGLVGRHHENEKSNRTYRIAFGR